MIGTIAKTAERAMWQQREAKTSTRFACVPRNTLATTARTALEVNS